MLLISHSGLTSFPLSSGLKPGVFWHVCVLRLGTYFLGGGYYASTFQSSSWGSFIAADSGTAGHK